MGRRWPQPWRINAEIASRRDDLRRISARSPIHEHTRPKVKRPGDLLGMANGVFDRESAALRYSKEDEAVEARGLDDAFEIARRMHRRTHPDRSCVGKAVQAAVVAYKREAAGQAVDPMSPNRAFPIEVEMGHPVRGTHDRRPGSAD